MNILENNTIKLVSQGFKGTPDKSKLVIPANTLAVICDEDTFHYLPLEEGEEPFSVDLDDGRVMDIYRVGGGFMPASALPHEGMEILGPGEFITVPSVKPVPDHAIPTLSKPSDFCVPAPTTLSKFDVTSRYEEFKERADLATPLLGELCYRGFYTIWFAAPNTGKTLLVCRMMIDAVDEERIVGEHVYFVNADDSAHGITAKIELLGDKGINMLVPGDNGFECHHLPELMADMIDKGEAFGRVIVLDTLKKFVDPMDKKKSRNFNTLCRKFVVAGGTVLALAHTNKHSDKDGRPVFAGTSDMLDDVDAAFILHPAAPKPSVDCRLIRAERKKSRGFGPEVGYFKYDPAEGISYSERIGSVTILEDDDCDEYGLSETLNNDALAIKAIQQAIEGGETKKMALAKLASKQLHMSIQYAVKVLEKYTGEDPAKHFWRTTRGARGAWIHSLLEERPDDGRA